MRTYLYAQWTLKRDEREGLTAVEKEAVDRWRVSMRHVAMQEMLHLALVNNLLAAIGAAPHLWRPEFPVARGYFPADVDFHLAPFNEQSIAHFTIIEKPEDIDVDDGIGFAHESRYRRAVCPDLLTPTPRDYTSQGHLYHGIARAIHRLVDTLGEAGLFVGHGEAQIALPEFPLPGLFKVRGLESAMRAIDEIVMQGEGAPAHRNDSHYARFAAIRDEFRQRRENRPDFVPAHPAAVNPVLTEFADGDDVAHVTNPQARRLVDLGNAIYGLMLHTTVQVCAPTPLPGGLRQGLSDVSAELMTLLGTAGEAAARTSIVEPHDGVNAGLSFALPRSFGPLVQANAAQILGERCAELAAASRAIEQDTPLPGVAARLDKLSLALSEMHESYDGHFTIGVETTGAGENKIGAVAKASPSSGEAIDEASSEDITLRFNTKRCIHSQQCVLSAPRVFLANAEGPWLHPEADTVEHLVHVARSCPSGAITYRRLDGGAAEAAPEINVMRIRENGPYALQAEIRIDGQGDMVRATLCRCGRSRNKPFCDNTHQETGFAATGEPDPLPCEPLSERGGDLRVSPVKNGPLRLRGPIEICSGTGRTVTRTLDVRLCRCGASSNKPFCDNSHRRIGFRSD